MRRASFVVGALVAALALAGCGAGTDRAQRVTLAALELPGPPSKASPPEPAVPCQHLTASLRPPATMPTPGAMPAGSFMARIEQRGYLLAGVDQNTFRFAYFNPLVGHVEGFEIDLLRQIAKAIFGNPNAIKFVALTTSERFTAVRQGTVDIVADAATIDCYRKTLVDFSTVYFDAGQKILVPSNSTARSVRDLAGRRICATTDSTTIATLYRLRPPVIPYGVSQRTDCLVALQEGLVDAISSDDSILLGFKAQDPFTKVAGPSIAAEPYGMAINKAHPEFASFVNGVLAQMRRNGTWRAIYAHWLGKPVPAPPSAQYGG